ncbi:hypothetical protein B0H11DRAFT_377143 [Mycena galericulata]|nr:hypothetical protein B0H11DRAFT_377143 [Mycena galericulata]
MPSLAPVFVAPVKHSPPIPVLSTSLPEPPSLVPALKIMKRKRPDTTTVSKTSAAAAAPSPIPDSASLSKPPTLINSGPARIASVPSTGRYVTEGPGPWRVPLSTSDKERVSATARIHKPTPGTTLLGPRRIPLPSQAPVPAPDPAPAVALPKAQVVQASGGPGLKGALRAVPPNGSASRVPRAAGGISNPNGSRLPMPKSKIAGLTSGMSGLPRRKVA